MNRQSVEGENKFRYGEGDPSFFDNRIGRLLTVRELAKSLQCSEGTIRNMVWKGEIPTVRPTPRMVRFDAEVIHRWLSERSIEYV